jgi:hypothetical protein
VEEVLAAVVLVVIASHVMVAVADPLVLQQHFKNIQLLVERHTQ